MERVQTLGCKMALVIEGGCFHIPQAVTEPVIMNSDVPLRTSKKAMKFVLDGFTLFNIDEFVDLTTVPGCELIHKKWKPVTPETK